MTSDIFLFIGMTLPFIGIMAVAWWAAQLRGWKQGYQAAEADELLKKQHLAEERQEYLKKALGLDSRTFVSTKHVVHQEATGLEFSVYTNMSVMLPPCWMPDTLMAEVLADMLEERRLLLLL